MLSSAPHKKSTDKLKKMKQIIFQFLLSILVSLVLFCVPILTIFVHLPLKIAVKLCSLLFRPDLQHFLPGISALISLEDTHSNPEINLCTFYVFDGNININSFRNIFQKRVLEKMISGKCKKRMYPELCMYWTTFLNYRFWKCEDFNLENHIRLYDYKGELKLPGVREGFCTESDLQRVMGPLLEKPWEKEQSPWEMLLIHNYNYNYINKKSVGEKASSVLLFRWHHALLDGYSTTKLIVRDLMLAEPQLYVPPKWTLVENLLFYSTIPFKLPWDLARVIINVVDGSNCWRGNGANFKLSNKYTVAMSPPVDMQRIKKLKNKFGVGYNAVLGLVAAKSCQKLMEAAGQVVPKQMSFALAYPVPNHPDGCTNHFTSQVYKSPMNTKQSKKNQLRIIDEGVRPSKFFTAPLTSCFIVSKYSYFAPNFMLKLIRINPATVNISMMSIAQKPIEFRGLGLNCVDFIAANIPGFESTGVMLTLYSILGNQRFTIAIDKGIYPCEKLVGQFGDFVEEALGVLEDACQD